MFVCYFYVEEIRIVYIMLNRIFFTEFFWLCNISDKLLTIFHFTKCTLFLPSNYMLYC